MTTATAPSACPGIRRDGSLEDGENRLQLGAQVFHRLRGERASRFGFQLPRAAILLDFLARAFDRSEEHTSELQSRLHLVCRLLLEKKKKNSTTLRVIGASILRSAMI